MTDITADRILKVIEGILLMELDETPIMTRIYRFAHLRSKCKENHPKWVEEFLTVEKYIHEIMGAPAKRNEKEYQKAVSNYKKMEKE